MSRSKEILKVALTVPGLTAPLTLLRRHRAVIFMLHRFRDPALGIEGHDPGCLRRGLDYLRRRRYELVSLAELFERLAGRGRPLQGAIAFTMDDGYRDQATVGGAIFAEFDCPVTTFVTTGFLDRQLWFWWDRIEYVFRRTPRRRLEIRVGPSELTYRWESGAERLAAQLDLIERCKEVADGDKEAAIHALAAIADVDLPERVPDVYAPMSWDELRRCETAGMSFGPHTVTHPILGRTPDEQSCRELRESWARLTAEAHRPVPVFCYPNGRWRDFGGRETATLRALGFAGAVVGEPGYADRASFGRDGEGPFRVRRFHFPETIGDLVQLTSGIEHLKYLVRGGA